MQLLQLSSNLQTGGQFTAESPGQFSTEPLVSFPRNRVVTISGISIQDAFKHVNVAIDTNRMKCSKN